MRSIALSAGDVIYRQGDPSACVFFVEDGEVEVRVGVGASADEVALATLGKGEILGEMGVIRNCVRSTTLVCVTDVRLMRIEGADFLKTFGGPDGVGLKLLRMICDRLTATSRGAGDARPSLQASRKDVGEIRILGASPEMEHMLGPTGVVVGHLPFEVGRAPGMALAAEQDRIGLPIPGASSQLAERHFRIELGAKGGLWLRDLESRYGCIVNGKRISAFERIEQGPRAPLLIGDNTVVAGGLYSPLRFKLRLRQTRAVAA